MELSDYLDLLTGLQFNKFILLHRRNYLQNTVSGEVGRKKSSWHEKLKVVQSTSVNIDISSVKIGQRYAPLLETFQYRDENYNRLKKLLSDQDVLSLTYEDDILENPIIAYNKVCEFLSVPGQDPVVPLNRTNPFAYEEMIENFDEVEAVLRGTEYEWMLTH